MARNAFGNFKVVAKGLNSFSPIHQTLPVYWARTETHLLEMYDTMVTSRQTIDIISPIYVTALSATPSGLGSVASTTGDTSYK